MTNAFEIEPLSHSIPESEIDRAIEMWEIYSLNEADEIVASLPDDEHEPSTQYPYM